MDIERLNELRKRLEYNSELEDEEIENLWELIDEAIARQSAEDKNVPTSEEVAEAIGYIEKLQQALENDMYWRSDKLMESLDLAITALQAYQPWIPCSASMPQDGELVIILFDGKTATAEYDKECHDFNTNVFIVHEDAVTHWMPLPQPPKGE